MLTWVSMATLQHLEFLLAAVVINQYIHVCWHIYIHLRMANCGCFIRPKLFRKKKGFLNLQLAAELVFWSVVARAKYRCNTTCWSSFEETPVRKDVLFVFVWSLGIISKTVMLDQKIYGSTLPLRRPTRYASFFMLVLILFAHKRTAIYFPRGH